MSCGGDPQKPAPQGTISAKALKTALSSSLFIDFKTALTLKATGSAQLPFAISAKASLLMQTSQAAASEVPNSSHCVITTGEAHDLDIDGLPNLLKQRFDCEIDGDGEILSFYGHLVRDDKDDQIYGAIGGYRFAFDLMQVSHTAKRIETARYKGLHGPDAEGGAIRMFSDYTIDTETAFKDALERKTRMKAVHKIETLYTPVETTSSLIKGSIQTAGTIALSGVMIDPLSNELQPLDVVFVVEAKDLTYDFVACPQTFLKSGELVFTDGTQNQLVYTYKNCEESRTYNGNQI
jgi:hypothetical protein